jgi:hypothetical protein
MVETSYLSKRSLASCFTSSRTKVATMECELSGSLIRKVNRIIGISGKRHLSIDKILPNFQGKGK